MTQHDRGQVLINDFELLREFLIEGNTDKLKEVLENFENFLDIEFKFKSKKGNAKVNTGNAICIACYFGHKDVVNLLISNPSFSGEVEVGKILNTYQGNIDDHDMTAIDIAASNGNTEIAKILLDNNALILNSEEDDDGADMNPFKFAALNKKLGMMNFLLNKAKDISLSEDALKFSLTEAIENVILSFKEDIGRGDELCDNIIKFLLDHGADTNYFSDESRTSFLNDTLEMKRYDLAYLFIQKGADIEYACKKYKHGNEKWKS
jgi:ankyrin repeat protein